MAVTLQNNADIFAANRATGHIVLSVTANGGKTRRERVHEDGSLRVRFPNATSEALEAVIINSAGGMTGGDSFGVEITLGEGAKLVAGTAAAEKIYRSTGVDTGMAVTLRIGPGATLAWLPQETILFDRARMSRRIDIDLAEDASLVLAEAVVFGRVAMGEAVEQGFFADRWRVLRKEKLVFAENVRLDGAIMQKMAQPAVANGGIAIATVLIVPADKTKIEAVRALSDQFQGEAGISAWNGIAVARLCARDGAALRHDLIAIFTALGVDVPRLWLN